MTDTNRLSKEEKEQLALGISTNEILQKLNISIENLPQKHRNILSEAANHKRTLGVSNLQPTTLLHDSCHKTLNDINEEYEILVLKQYNRSLDSEIKRNDKEIESLKMCLEAARETFVTPQFTGADINNEIRSLKQKTTSYDENLEKAKTKLQKLKVPEEFYPKNIEELVKQLVSLRLECSELKLRADDVKLSSRLRHHLRTLRH